MKSRIFNLLMVLVCAVSVLGDLGIEFRNPDKDSPKFVRDFVHLAPRVAVVEIA